MNSPKTKTKGVTAKPVTIKYISFVIFFLLFFLAAIVVLTGLKRNSSNLIFSGENALGYLQYQVSLGARIPGSEAHTQVISWLQQKLTSCNWLVEQQTSTTLGHPITNIVAKRGSGTPWTILGAHYDSRIFADRDPEPLNRNKPVIGANDGASGVAVLVELACVLPRNLQGQVWLVFFDAEDQGDIKGWDWILGSRVFAQLLTSKPDSVVIIDMIGDKNLNIYYESNSDQLLSQEIWSVAKKAGFQNQFIPKVKYSILDDHTPFLEKGIRAIDIIDFDYQYWHTIADTPDKVSSESLQAVGETLFSWLMIQ